MIRLDIFIALVVDDWIEEFYTPYALQDLMLQILEQTKKESQERLTAISNSTK